MERTLAEFPDSKTATAAVHQLVAKSFAAEDLELHAVRSDGSSVPVPVRHRSQFGTGFVVGGVMALPIGVAMVGSLGMDASPSLALLAIGLGATLGATLGVGWWNVSPDTAQIPSDAARFVVVVSVPPGRTAHAQSVMQEAGGVDATPRETPAEVPPAQ